MIKFNYYYSIWICL